MLIQQDHAQQMPHAVHAHAYLERTGLSLSTRFYTV